MPGDERPPTLEEKRARLARALERKSLQPVESPLSFGQQRLWFVDQLDPGSPLYNITVAIRVSGPLRPDVLQRVVDAIVMRHESLRTTFGVKGGMPLQIVAPRAAIAIEPVAVPRLAGTTIDEQVTRFVREQALTRFDLAQGPLCRVALLRVGPEEHYVCFTTHHIISDGWSVGVVLYEVAAHYGALTGKPVPPLPPLRIQYRDYARWQREKLQGAELDRLLAFWQSQLAGAPHTLELPTDRPRPQRVTYDGTIHRFRFPAPLLDSLKELSRQEGATLFMTMLAGFATLLYRFTGQEDMLIGVPITGRERAEIQPLIGYFVNIVVVRVQLADDPPFRELLARVRQSTLDAYAHQEIPFEKLVEALQPRRVLDRNPLIQVVYLHQNFPLPRPDSSPGLLIEPLEIHPGFSRFELGLRTEQTSDGVECLFEYNTDLFSAGTIERLAGHFRTLLHGVVAAPGARLATIPLLTDAQRRQLLRPATLSATVPLEFNTLPEAFAHQARKTPEAVAVVESQRQWTYAELQGWAEHVTARLRELGVRTGDRLGLYLTPSAARVAAELAILKAGGTCVPLDVNDPPERTATLLEDASVGCVLATGAASAVAPRSRSRSTDCQIVAVEEWCPTSLDERCPEEAPTCRAGDPAYVIYTAGADGRPQGVLIEHQHVLHRLRAARRSCRLAAGDGFALLSSWTAETALAAIFQPLLAGARLHILAAEPGAGPQPRSVTAGRGPVDVLQALPSQVAALLEAEDASDALPRRCLILAGESLGWDFAARLRRLAPGLAVYQQAGFAETAGVALAYEIPSAIGNPDARPAASVPLGRPLDHMYAYVLDRHQQPVPVGVPGELYLGGASLARDYLRPPAGPGHGFVPDPVGVTAGARLYRTRLRVRVLPDGDVELLGHLDDQILRGGHRVFPAEVQRVVAQHPRVSQCVVVPWPRPVAAGTASGGGVLPADSLAAYVVPAAPVAPTVHELQTWLHDRLPPYMMPAAFVLLEQLPRGPDGQLDRAALPPPPSRRPAMSGDHVAPRTETERSLAAVWRDVLGVQELGIHDDFFELGGNSLLALQLATVVRERWTAAVPLRALFQEPTIATTARLIDAALASGSRAGPPTIPRAPHGARLPLSPSQQGLYLLEQFEQGIAFNAALAFRLRGPLQREALVHSLEELLRRHDILRASIRLIEGQPTHVLNPPGPLALASHDLRALPQEQRGPEAQRLAEDMTRTPFDPAAGYLIRFLLAQLDDEEHLLFAAVHHLVADGWSFPILFEELTRLYEAFSAGQPPSLPELPIQFTDYTYWQRHREHVLSADDTTFWRATLAGPLPVLALPADFVRTKRMAVEPGVCELVVAAETHHALQELGRQEGATLYMTLLAAYLVLLHRYSRQKDLLVGAVTANRLLPETHRLIGFFASLLPLRCDLSDDPSFLELLGRVRRLCADAFSRPEPDLEQLASLMQPTLPGAMPVCQTLLTFGEFPEQSVSTGPLTWTPFNLNVVRFSGFDLVLAFRRDADALAGTLLYRPDLFRAETAARFRESFLTLLRGIVANPATRISRLPVLTAADRQCLLGAWNDTATAFPAERCLHELFEAQAASTPEAPAVLAEGWLLTYRGLNGRANHWARQLRHLKVDADTLVAVLVERGPEMIAALLAVLKAGGAYVPLDPSWPPSRIETVLADAHISVVVLQRHLAERLSGVKPIPERILHRLYLEAPAAASGAPESDASLPSLAKPEHLAYVIYTSGSSGPPKGVMVEHRSVVNVVTSFARTYELNARDRVLQQASAAFDVSVNEIFPVLSVGGAVVLPPPEATADFDRLAELVASRQVTILGATPSGLTELNRRAARLRSVRLVLSGGETLAQSHVDQLTQFATVTNGYGPTETTVCATYYDLRTQPREEAALIPIGKPLPNYQVYVVDEQLEPVPVGCAGELCIAGVGLARGYLGDAELTARKFVANPFSPGQRLYRTGDEGRWRPDGNLEFLGRLDRQVKVRGFRVELGDVEAALSRHPGVAQAIAICDRDASGNGRVVAYVVPRTAMDLAAALPTELRRFLLQELPAYMVPAAFVLLGSIPLTANQKVDYAALPKAQVLRPSLDVPYTAPRTPDEERLAAIWREALGLEQVGIHDSFFLLGGHSLLAAQVMHRVQEEFAVAFPYRLFFQAPTIAQMAQRLEAIRRGEGDAQSLAPAEVDPLVPLFAGSHAVPLYCVHAFGGQAYGYGRLAQSLGAVCPVYGIQSRAIFESAKEAPSWQAMGEDYAQVLRHHQPDGPYQLLGHSAGGVLALAITHALEQSGAEVRLVCLVDSYWNLDEVSVGRGAEQELVAELRATLGQFAIPLPGAWDAILADPDRLHDEFFALPYEARLDKLHAWIASLPSLSPGLIDQLTNQLRLHDLHRCRFNAYRLPRVAAPLCVVWAEEAVPGTRPLPRYDWAQWTSGGVQTFTLPANHFTVLAPPAVEQLARLLQPQLQSSRASEAANATAHSPGAPPSGCER